MGKLLMLLSLIIALPAFGEYKITKEFIPAQSEYQMQLGERERPNLYIQPSLFIYNSTQWTYKGVLNQLKRADFLLHRLQNAFLVVDDRTNLMVQQQRRWFVQCAVHPFTDRARRT